MDGTRKTRRGYLVQRPSLIAKTTFVSSKWLIFVRILWNKTILTVVEIVSVDDEDSKGGGKKRKVCVMGEGKAMCRGKRKVRQQQNVGKCSCIFSPPVGRMTYLYIGHSAGGAIKKVRQVQTYICKDNG
jgi:hypothetical protein